MKLDKLFRTAVEYNASDIYISTGWKPVLRINGDLIAVEDHPVLTREMSQDYILETMNDEQKNKFQHDLDLDYALGIAEVARFRVNAFVQSKGLSAIFRLIPSTVHSMDELGIPSQLKKITGFSSGIVLVTGPTGSGKTTTLASILNEINTTQKKHIITIEDPIEYVHANKHCIIEQREIGNHTASFARALRSSLREDPDVLMIGEMRDLETMSLAITAAETGRLVLGTIHTSGAAKSVDRVIDAFPHDQQNQIRVQFSESLRCVVWQNLLKRKDGKSRVGAFEIMFNNHAIANLIRKNKTFQISSAIETGMGEGMQTMKHALELLVEQGVISEQTAQENLPDEMDMA